MMRIGDKKNMTYHKIILNLSITSILVFIFWFIFTKVGGEGILSYIGLLLYMPIFLIISVVTGAWAAMHSISSKTYLFVGFIFYSLLIALIQIFIYKRKKRKRQETCSKGRVR